MIEIEIDDGLKKQLQKHPVQRDQFLRATGKAVVNEWRLSMQRTPKGGRKYKVSKTGPPHEASLPGNPPAVMDGVLIAELRSETSDRGLDFFGTDYGLILDNERDRPFIEPGIRAVDIPRIGRQFLGEG